MSLGRDLRPVSVDFSPAQWSPTGRSTTTQLSNAPNRRAGATSNDIVVTRAMMYALSQTLTSAAANRHSRVIASFGCGLQRIYMG